MQEKSKSHVRMMAALAGLIIAVAGCTSSGTSNASNSNAAAKSGGGGGASVMSGGLKNASQVKIIYVGCGPATNPFWAVVARGAQEAADNQGIHYQFLYPTGQTVADLNQTTQSAIAAKPDGIALCGLDPVGQTSTINQAKAAGIAVVLTPPEGSGIIRDSSLPFIGQVGQDEPIGGTLAADQAVSRWHAKDIVCTRDGFDATQGERCNGLLAEAKKLGIKASVQVVPDDQGQAANVMTSLLRRDPSIDTVVCTNSDVTLGVIEAKQNASRSNVHLIDFDLNSGVLQGIQNGTVDIAIDQQQYWRGYIPVLLLTQYIRYGLVMADNFMTGPSIVDKSNVQSVIQLVSENIR
jgi:simple sugar transport system substrate-binding protein